MSLAVRVLVLFAALAACKDKPTSAPPVVVDPTPLPHATGSAPAPKPALPAEAKPPSTAPMSIEDARAALPKLTGTLILDLKQTSDKLQVHGTWCMDGTGADDVAKQVAKAMDEAGYVTLSIRGDARKSGVSGDRGPIRMSMIVAASGAASCAAPAHYFASATMFRP